MNAATHFVIVPIQTAQVLISDRNYGDEMETSFFTNLSPNLAANRFAHQNFS